MRNLILLIFFIAVTDVNAASSPAVSAATSIVPVCNHGIGKTAITD